MESQTERNLTTRVIWHYASSHSPHDLLNDVQERDHCPLLHQLSDAKIYVTTSNT